MNYNKKYVTPEIVLSQFESIGIFAGSTSGTFSDYDYEGYEIV